MARPKQIIRSVPCNISLPEDLKARIDLHLFSEVEGRVPFGAYREFFSMLIREHFQVETANEREVE